MKEQDEWVFFKEIDFKDPKFNRFNVDTRDFHVGYSFSKEPHPDINILKKYRHFFLSENQLKELLNRYFEESGGKCEWRHFSLDNSDYRCDGWNMKYIRIFRHEMEFIVCNNYESAIPKDILKSDILKSKLYLE